MLVCHLCSLLYLVSFHHGNNFVRSGIYKLFRFNKLKKKAGPTKVSAGEKVSNHLQPLSRLEWQRCYLGLTPRSALLPYFHMPPPSLHPSPLPRPWHGVGPQGSHWFQLHCCEGGGLGPDTAPSAAEPTSSCLPQPPSQTELYKPDARLTGPLMGLISPNSSRIPFQRD